jgi:hypothetical protein
MYEVKADHLWRFPFIKVASDGVLNIGMEFLKRVDAYPFLGCVAVLLEVCAVAFLVVMRWKKLSAEGRGK